MILSDVLIEMGLDPAGLFLIRREDRVIMPKKRTPTIIKVFLQSYSSIRALMRGAKIRPPIPTPAITRPSASPALGL
jgi:hypothetical protein